MNKYTDKIMRGITALAEEGKAKAEFEFDRAIYAGPNETKIYLTETKDGYEIEARGKDVLFKEYGTGLQSGTRAGSYGQHRGSNPKGWFYPASRGLGENKPVDTEISSKNSNLIHTYGNPPNRCMYYTHRHLEEKMEEIFDREWEK